MQLTRTKQEHELPATPDGEQVRAELAAILDSAVFRTSKRCRDFLRYVVTQTLQGDFQSLRERSLAVEVFGRRTDAALGDDSIVRVGAREVRKRLAQYYMTEGAQAAIRIDLPPGSYVPIFHAQPAQALERPAVGGEAVVPLAFPVAPTSQLAAKPVAAKSLLAKPDRSQNKKKWLIASGIVAALLSGAVFWRTTRLAVPEEFDTFWQPAFVQHAPVFLGMAHPIVYHPSNRLIKLDEEANGAETALQRQVRVAAEPKRNDYVPVFDQYVGFGDAMAASRLSILFAQHHRPVTARLASKLNFVDLRDSPAILIGAFTNRWTTELVQGFRYRFQISLGVPWILDSATGKRWLLAGKTENGLANEDYILICRLTRTQTGGFVIIAAGLTQYGTEEAGRILSDPESLAPILRRVPPDWRNRDLELVLHSQVLGETSTAPELVAWHVW
ncbi:MAG TPA: hypothetical protein VK604_05235 [Bryobacteraceae bacterium]|nr:hypothetical protein [Bryobacteraceae bacterium]